MIARILVLSAITALAVACSPGEMALVDRVVSQSDFSVADSEWNKRACYLWNGAIYTVSVSSEGSDCSIVLFQALEGKLQQVAAYSWVRANPSNRVFFSGPIRAWDDAFYVLVHDSNREAVVIRLPLEGVSTVLWNGSAGITAQLVFSSTQNRLLLFDHALVVFLDEYGAESGRKNLGEGPVLPAVISDQAFVGIENRLISLASNENLRSKYWMKNAIRQITGFNGHGVLITQRRFSDVEDLELVSLGKNETEWSRFSLTAGVWRLRPTGNCAAVWEVDTGEIIITDGSEFSRLSWHPPNESMYWVAVGDSCERFVVATDTGYSILASP